MNKKIFIKNINKTIIYNQEFSLLELFEKHNIDIKHSCRIGACHLCKFNLQNGSIKYIKKPLMDEKNLACCSVPITNLEINIE